MSRQSCFVCRLPMPSCLLTQRASKNSNSKYPSSNHLLTHQTKNALNTNISAPDCYWKNGSPGAISIHQIFSWEYWWSAIGFQISYFLQSDDRLYTCQTFQPFSFETVLHQLSDLTLDPPFTPRHTQRVKAGLPKIFVTSFRNLVSHFSSGPFVTFTCIYMLIYDWLIIKGY